MRRATALAVLAVLLAACGRVVVPPSLGGLKRTRVLAGRQAVALVARMHGQDVAPADTTIAEYGHEGTLRVWVSRYDEGATAQSEFRRMLAGMRGGSTPFTRPTEDRNTPGRWTAVGNGQHHVLWVSEDTLYWLEGDPRVVFRAAAELPAPTAGVLV